MGFNYIPPQTGRSASPRVDTAQNPWTLMHDYSKTVVTLASSILALTVTFGNSLAGKSPTTGMLTLLVLSWFFLIVTIAAALYVAGRLIGYLRGVRQSPAPAPFLCNVSYFSLFLALFFFGWSGLSRLIIRPEKKPEVPARQGYLK